MSQNTSNHFHVPELFRTQSEESESTQPQESVSSTLPSQEEFFSLIDDERKLTQDHVLPSEGESTVPGYYVYHKYNKGT